MGRLLQQKIHADRARAAQPCDGCGHERGGHRELPPVYYALVGGALVEEPTPDYRALDFHCGVEGCSCVLRPAGELTVADHSAIVADRTRAEEER